MKKLFSLITLFALSSIVNAQGTSTSNFTANATLNSSCAISTTSAVNLTNVSVNQSVSIRSRILFNCSKGVTANVGYLSDEYSSTNNTHRYLKGANPTNNDKIVYIIGASPYAYPTDGTNAGAGPGGVYIGSGTPTQQGGGLIRILVVGAVIDGVFTDSNFKVTPDNYVSNVTITLTY